MRATLKNDILAHFSKNKPETLSKDCWHLVEAIGTAIWEDFLWISHSKNTIQDEFSSSFHLPYQFCYTHIHYFNSCRNFRQFTLGTSVIWTSEYCPLSLRSFKHTQIAYLSHILGKNVLTFCAVLSHYTSFEEECNWHVDCMNVHQICCHRV